MDDEFAAFMSEISSISSDPKPEEPASAAATSAVPKKRGLPAAYRNRTGFYESEAAKTRRIEKAIDESSDRQPVQKKLADATISAAPVRNNFASGTISAPAQTLNSGDRKIGLEKVEITPFFGNEQQAFSMKSNAIASTPISYQAIKEDNEAKQKHMSDKELKAKIESQPTSAFSIGPKSGKDSDKKKDKKEKAEKTGDQKPAFASHDKKLEARGKKFVRRAAGQTWEDNTLSEWDPTDYRLFCGDLGNEVTDEILTRAFNKYPSFLKAKVVREKGPKMGKTKGYGFISFRDPEDFIRAMREMNGKYVGNRPIKLRKSSWKDRQLEVVKKKTKEKRKLGYRV